MFIAILLAVVPFFGLSLAQDPALVRFGPVFSVGPLDTDVNHIIDADTTLLLGPPPNPQADRLAVWPGMGTDRHGLIQSIAASLDSDERAINCNGTAGQWCVFTYTLVCNAAGTECSPDFGHGNVPMDPNHKLNIRYAYDEPSGFTNQTLKLDGNVVSTQSTNVGKSLYWMTAVECQEHCSGIVGAHCYANTTLVLAYPDPNFGTMLQNSHNVTYTDVTSPDGGKTWKIDEIYVKEWNFAPVEKRDLEAHPASSSFAFK